MLPFCGGGLLQQSCHAARVCLILLPSRDCWLHACFALGWGVLDGLPLARVRYLARQWQSISQVSPAPTTWPSASHQRTHFSSTKNTATRGIEPVSPAATWSEFLLHTPIRPVHVKCLTSLAFIKAPQLLGGLGSNGWLCGQQTVCILSIAWLPAALPLSVVVSCTSNTRSYSRMPKTMAKLLAQLPAVPWAMYLGATHHSTASWSKFLMMRVAS